MTPGERLEEARAFIARHYREAPPMDGQSCPRRQAAVAAELKRTGTYRHTPEELVFGARIAWRNHARCIGRSLWSSLVVLDFRDTSDPDTIAARTFEHMRRADRDGKLQSVMSVFAPAAPGASPCFIENDQVLQYAGYFADGEVIGDRRNIEFTRIAKQLGWTAPQTPGPFDLLPLIIRDTHGNRRLYDIPADVAREVPIRHPEYPALAELGLRWYAVPCVSGMIMTIGGIDYPCAPFSGFYMATEIASRNFADENRYDMLLPAARAFGFATQRGQDMFWKDRTLIELNRAVLESYRSARVTIIDHHSASEQYMIFDRRERAAGRPPSGEWAWIVPPQASAGCPVFHLPMTDLGAVPNFYRSRATDGVALRETYSDETHTTRVQDRMRRLRGRYRNWRRRRD
ncbi:nitric oxide synthase oxygenase [Qipengyuania sp.]|uniref:nitric oxide synthase oxygenase n=1 Tax=Qipengyuania sp. TaxID=2004515 RepID=UPI0035C8030B